MIILAFDLATNTGVAIGDAREHPVCLSENLGEAGPSHGARFSQAFHLTARLIKKHQPDLIAIEAAIAGGAVGGETRVQIAFGMRAAVLAVAHMRNIRVVECRVTSVRKHFIGRGNLPGPKAKTVVFNRCKQLGWAVENDNESDACAVWDFARMKHCKKSTLPPNGLFEHAEQQRRGAKTAPTPRRS